MIALDQLTRRELERLKTDVLEENSKLDRSLSTANHQMDSVEERRARDQETIRSLEASLSTTSTLLQDFQENGSSPELIAEYEQKKKKLELQIELEQLDALDNGGNELAIRQKKVAHIQYKQSDFQQWIADIETAITALG